MRFLECGLLMDEAADVAEVTCSGEYRELVMERFS